MHRIASQVLSEQPRTPVQGAGAGANGVPHALAGVKIPTHNRTVYRRVLDAYWRDQEDAQALGIRRLTTDALPLVVSLFDLVQRRRKLAKALDAQHRRHGVLIAEGEPRKGDERLLAFDGMILRQLDALGWTPTALARLGVDLVRLRSASKGTDGAADPEAVEAVEARIMQRLSGDGQGQEADGHSD